MATETLILAADTSTRHCSAALCACGGETNACSLLAQTQADRHRLHAEGLLDSLDWVLNASGKTLDAVDFLAIAIGPGSFTGLRVGAAAWKGLAFALNKPLVAVPTLDAFSLLNPVADGLVMPLIDARMKEVFGAVYHFEGWKRTKLTPDRVCSVETLVRDLPRLEIPVYAWGDGALRYEETLRAVCPNIHIVQPPHDAPRADCVAREAWALLQQGVDTDPAHAAPRYLRASQAEQAKAAAALNAAQAPASE